MKTNELSELLRPHKERIAAANAEREKMRENSSKPQPINLIDASKILTSPDAPPPTTEELLWLKDKLIEQQQSIDKLIGLIEELLSKNKEENC